MNVADIKLHKINAFQLVPLPVILLSGDISAMCFLECVWVVSMCVMFVCAWRRVSVCAHAGEI